MTTPLSLYARKARLLALREVIDAGGGAVLLYTGTELPASPETATAEQLLGRIPLAAPSAGIGDAAGQALLTFAVPRIALARASGVVGWARIVDGGDAGVMDLPAGLPGSLQPVILSKLQVYTGGELRLVSCVVAE